MNRREWLAAAAAPLFAAEDFPDLSTVKPDLAVPPVTPGSAAPGKRIRETHPEFARTAVHHTVYLPVDWQPGRKYPVIVEYAGNGDYRSPYGDVSTGEVEGSKLGYGISGGRGFIWVCMPYVDTTHKRNQTIWWGNLEATVRYACITVPRICELYGGDPSTVILAGFSRGSIGCNYVGLHDDRIAGLWLAFIAYSHYDGVVDTWVYPAADRASALVRLKRLKGRAVFICHERSVEKTRVYIESTGIRAPFTFQPIGFRNHNDAWTLRDIPERRAVRGWLSEVLRTRPGAAKK